MKKLILLLLFSAFLFANQVVKLVGDKSYPPYSYSENGIAKGIYVDIIKKAFSKVDGYDVKFKMIAFKKAKVMVKKGKAIGFFPPYYSKSRAQWTKFSEPILEENTIIFAKKSMLKGKKDFPKDFYGKTLCLNRGFSQESMGGAELKKAIKNKKIKLIEADNNKACLARIQRKLADFYINDRFIDISKFPMIKRGEKVKSNFGYIGFTLKTKKYPYMDDLQTKLNKAIKMMKKNHEIDKITKKYI